MIGGSLTSLTFLIFLLFADVMDLFNHIRVNADIFRLNRTGTRCGCVHALLSLDPVSPFSLQSLVATFQFQFQPNSPWYPSLLRLYSQTSGTSDETSLYQLIGNDRDRLRELSGSTNFSSCR